MGVVYLAETPGRNKVAIKCIHPELVIDRDFRRRFAREVAATQSVGGLFTARVIEAEVDGPLPYLVIEYVEGPSLADYVKTNGAMPPQSVVALAAGLAEGLAAIHAVGVSHRDLKPSNVLLSSTGPKIVDFGIAAALGATTITQAGTVIGTPAWLSPEHVTDGDVTRASDIFSWAGVVVFAASGRPPFGDVRPDVYVARLLQAAPHLESLPRELTSLAAAAFAKNPLARPTAAELLNSLSDPGPAAFSMLGETQSAARSEPETLVVSSEPLSTDSTQALPMLDQRTAVRPETPSKRSRRAALLIGLLCFVLLGASFGVSYLVAGHRHRHPVSEPRIGAPKESPSVPQQTPSGSTVVTGRIHHGPSVLPAVAPLSSAAPSYEPSDSSPVSVAYRYYDAINAQDWRQVWRLGGRNLGDSYASMVQGYAHTANDIPFFTSIDGGDLHLLLLAYETNGTAQLYSGNLTVEEGEIVRGGQTLEYTDTNRGFAALAGGWGGHDRDLQITQGGLGIMSFRTFTNCPDISVGCDQSLGNNIVNGGLVVFRLDSGQGNEATGRIVSSTVGPARPIAMRENRHQDTLSFSNFKDAPFCGANSPEGACGA
jgi:serine/threonine protein kinase